MDEPNLSQSLETPQDPVEIRDEDAITIEDALLLADDGAYPIGKSTLQRWAKFWHESQGAKRGVVRSILVDRPEGRIYKLSRDDFLAWLFDRKQNARPHDAPRDLEGSRKVFKDLHGSHETSPRFEEGTARAKELENENLQLRIDLGVRKQLLERAKDEMDSLRSMTDNLLRENGALQYRILQLAPPPPKPEPPQPQTIEPNAPTNPDLAI